MRIISIILTGLLGLMLTFSVQANPKRIGYIVNYGTHEWYQNVIFGLQSRANELGIELEVMDANLDINKQEILGMLGPNGVGKSTIFQIITGIKRNWIFLFQ